MEKKISFNEKFIAYLTLLSGLAISAVAIYYSVLGLTAIFAAAVIPIIIMGITLELSKLIATLWLKQNWNTAPVLIKTYLVIAIFVLMCITSMGIFGFLSKSHNDQLLVSGNNSIQLTEIDRQISLEKRTVDDSLKVISQLDQAVQSLIDADRIRGPSGSIAVRKSQAAERDSLNLVISQSTKKINELENQKLPLLQQKLNIESEVGPIKYIAKFVYGSDPNKDILEQAVTWVIVILIVVFDPLAIVLLLASQYSFQQFKTRTDDLIEKQSNIVNTSIKLDKKIEPTLINESEDDFDISKYPYLFKVPKNRHPPGVDPVGPMVFKNPIVKQSHDEEKLFIQNEEQLHSNLWTSTVSTSIITEKDYINSSKNKIDNLRKDEVFNYWAELVRNKKISMEDVPKHLLLEVRARV